MVLLKRLTECKVENEVDLYSSTVNVSHVHSALKLHTHTPVRNVVYLLI